MLITPIALEKLHIENISRVTSLYPAPSNDISPGGRHLVRVRIQYQPNSSTIATRFLELLDTDRRLLATIEMGEKVFEGAYAWSPDAKYLAFTISLERTRQAELWIMNSDGTNQRQIYTERYVRWFESLTWMPDGETLLFFLDPGGTSYNSGYTLAAINVRSKISKKLMQWGSSLRLSADGHKFTFYRDPRFNSDPEAGDFVGEFVW